MRGPTPGLGLTNRFQVRSVKDLEAAARAMAGLFDTDLVVVVGSQSILVDWPEAPVLMRTSPEIDAYPANAKAWEARASGPHAGMEASELANGLLGDGSPFHERHGFFVDGVDESTAALPSRWQSRACYREVKADGRTITAVAPSPVDLITAKSRRLAEKDVAYIKAYHEVRPLPIGLICHRLTMTRMSPEHIVRATEFFRSLPMTVRDDDARRHPVSRVPRCPVGSHCVFYDPRSGSMTVRRWDDDVRLFHKVDNPLDAAWTTIGLEKYFLDGNRLTAEEWGAHPRVTIRSGDDGPDGIVPTW